MPEDGDLERVAEVLGEADAGYEEDLAELEGVNQDALWEWTHQPDADTDGKEHD